MATLKSAGLVNGAVLRQLPFTTADIVTASATPTFDHMGSTVSIVHS